MQPEQQQQKQPPQPHQEQRRQQTAGQASSPAASSPTTEQPAADDPVDDALEATRRQVESHLTDLEEQEAHLTSPRPANWHAASAAAAAEAVVAAAAVSTDESEDESNDGGGVGVGIDNGGGSVQERVSNETAGNDDRSGRGIGTMDYNTAAAAAVDDEGFEDDVEDQEDDEDDDEESSSELELTIHGSPTTGLAGGGHSTAAAAIASAIATSGALWRQQTAARDQRSWHLFRQPVGRLRRGRRQSEDDLEAASSMSVTFSGEAERSSIPIGSGLCDLALAQLRRGTGEGHYVAAVATMVRVSKELFNNCLLAECSIAATTATAAAAAAATASAAASDASGASSVAAGRNAATSCNSRRRATWALIRGPK